MHEVKSIILNPAYHIRTEEFIDPAEVILLMTAGGNFFSYALMKLSSKEFVEFGYYTISNGREDDWDVFFENNNTLSERYSGSAIAFYLNESMLIPAGHFKPGEIQNQLDTFFGMNFHSVPVTEHLPDLSMYHVARIQESLHRVVSKRFNAGKFLSTNFLMLKNISGELSDYIRIDFRTDEFTVLVFKEKQLQLLKSFSYSSPEDILYYLLKICQQTELSQKDVKVILAGLIEKDSAIFRELYKYFIHLEFDELPAGISVAKDLTDCPQHYFSSIAKLATCVL